MPICVSGRQALNSKVKPVLSREGITSVGAVRGNSMLFNLRCLKSVTDTMVPSPGKLYIRLNEMEINQTLWLQCPYVNTLMLRACYTRTRLRTTAKVSSLSRDILGLSHPTIGENYPTHSNNHGDEERSLQGHSCIGLQVNWSSRRGRNLDEYDAVTVSNRSLLL
jgi:hypothetical protein